MIRHRGLFFWTDEMSGGCSTGDVTQNPGADAAGLAWIMFVGGFGGPDFLRLRSRFIKVER